MRWNRIPLLLLLLALVGTGVWWMLRARSSVLSVAGDLSGAAPEVVSLVEEAEADARKDPGDASRWGRLGMICEANGLIGAARRSYERASEIAGHEPRWWYRLALVSNRLGDSDLALRSVERALALNDQYAPAHWRRGFWLLDRGDTAGAQAAFQRATEIDSTDSGGWLGLARVFLQRREDPRAVEVLEKTLSASPGDGYALHLLGTAYRRLGRLEEAEYALAAASAREPVWRDVWTDEVSQYRRGFAPVLKEATRRLLAGQYDMAIPMLEQLHRQKPDDVALMNQLGLSYVAAGRVQDGLRVLVEALARSPDNVETHLRLASAYLQSGDVERALAHADRAVALNPTFGRAHEARGVVLWRTGRTEAALAAFRLAARYDPRNVQALVWIGSILNELGRWREALGHFEQAVRKNPALADASAGLAVAQMELGELGAAESALERAALLDPENPRVAAARARLNEIRAAHGIRRRRTRSG